MLKHERVYGTYASRLRIKIVEGSKQLAAEHDIKRTAQMLKEPYESLVAGGAPA